jgi:hypothetical protein
MLKTIGNPATRYGDQTIVDGNLVIGTAGKGIDFSSDGHASGVTSELLDDYEEGAWTPALSAGTTPPTATYFYRQGYYTRVGRLVTLVFKMFISGNSGGSGTAFIDGLPFTSSNLSDSHAQATLLSGLATMAPANGGFVEPGTTRIFLCKSDASTLDVSTLGTGFLFGTAQYYV